MRRDGAPLLAYGLADQPSPWRHVQTSGRVAKTYADLDQDASQTIIPYCQHGHRSAHTV
jgi:3-mercaptopyruvate sulfurtransferase SseA